MKDLFLKKLQICMKTYDYADETKDVKGKVRQVLSLERENQRYFWAIKLAIRAKECHAVDYS